MATLIQAVGRYGPRAVQGPHAEIDELCAWMARSSGLNANNAKQAFAELGDALVFYLRRGGPVVIPGLGRLRLSMDRYGDLRLNFVAEKDLLLKVLDKKSFNGLVANPEAGNWTDEQYKAAWDADFPDDPLVLPPPRPRRKRHLGPGRPVYSPEERLQRRKASEARRGERQG